MNLELMSFILVVSLFLLLALGIHVAIAIGLTASLGLFFFVKIPLDQFAFSAFGLMNSFTLTAVPLFVFMGAIFQNSGVIERLFDGVNKLLRFLPGGVVCSVIGANAIFGAMCGSSIAATATFGKICYPSLQKLGVSSSLTLGSIAVGGTLSVLIPPSVILVVYGGWELVSVARLFAAGLIPGVMLAMLLMATVIVWVKLSPEVAPKGVGVINTREWLVALSQILPFLAVIGLVLGLVFRGVMTPTESAAVGSFVAIMLTLAYRKMSLGVLKESMLTAVKITAMIALLMVSARVLGQVFQYIGLTDAVAATMLALPFGKYTIFAIICIMYLVLGMFFDSFSMLVLTLPFVSPIIQAMGFDLIWFGVIYVVLAEIGLITPPFGFNLFVLHSVVPEHDILSIARSVLPFLIPLLLMLVILTVFPQLALWFPRVLFSR